MTSRLLGIPLSPAISDDVGWVGAREKAEGSGTLIVQDRRELSAAEKAASGEPTATEPAAKPNVRAAAGA